MHLCSVIITIIFLSIIILNSSCSQHALTIKKDFLTFEMKRVVNDDILELHLGTKRYGLTFRDSSSL